MLAVVVQTTAAPVSAAAYVATMWFACVPLLCEQCVAAAAQQPAKIEDRSSKSENGETPIAVRPSTFDLRSSVFFAEGVRIDWPKLTVEVDAEVVLREGPLELFACSPRTREHESILRVSARPLHIFQAMGLIGLTPGKPLRFDEEAKRWEEPRGDRVELRVRYSDERGTHIVASQQWVSDAKGQDPARPIVLDWIFTGSTNLPHTSPNARVRWGEESTTRFSADADGTIACLVDFESALIALAARHSADNEQLWLIANTAQIPPRGTKCVLLIRSNTRPAMEVDMLDDHTVRVGERSLSPEQLADLLAPPSDDPRPAHLVIHPGPNVSDEAVKAFTERVTKSGFEGAIETKRRPPEKQAAPPD